MAPPRWLESGKASHGLAFEPGLWARQVLSRSVLSLWNDGTKDGAMRKKQREEVQGLVRHASVNSGDCETREGWGEE